MEHVAEVSGADPVEVRRLNFLKAYPVSEAPQIGCSVSSSTTQVGRAVLGSKSHISLLYAAEAHALSPKAPLPVRPPVPDAAVAVQGGHAIQRKEYGCSRLHQWPTPGPALMKTSLGR